MKLYVCWGTFPGAVVIKDSQNIMARGRANTTGRAD
jgi:hypothetical protein